jgi:hypothetical protein
MTQIYFDRVISNHLSGVSERRVLIMLHQALLGSMHSNDPITTNDVNVQVLNVLAFFT